MGESLVTFREQEGRRATPIRGFTSREAGGTYAFHAPDDKDYSIWFQSEGQKYKARVIYHGEPGDNLAALPLVSGPFMNAPGGHDGLVEIRHPGSERAPLVLDYRSAGRPRRIDNRASDPLPWIERAIALFEIAQHFGETARRKDALAATVDAVQLYDEFLRLNTDQNGPMLAPAVLRALGVMGVDFSVPEGELKEWLANPLFTPYPAMAQALLLLGRKLKAPVFLDVITHNYENTTGVTSPRTVAGVRLDRLKAAILEASNVRHGTNVGDFEQLLVPIAA